MSHVDVDALRLYKDLSLAVEGEVRFDRASLAMYANDASNFRQVPVGVVVPRTLDDVVAAHRVAAGHDAPILNRGGGTSLSGETVNYAVVIDHSKYLRRVEEPDVDARTVVCEPGVINQQLNESIRHTGWTFGPDPSSHSRCVIGGNIGNNSCGIHSVQSQFYGPGPRTSDNVERLEVVTYRGERFWVGATSEAEYEDIQAAGGERARIYRGMKQLVDRYGELIRERYPPVDRLPRRVSGYNLDDLLPENGFQVARALVGTEGTVATTLQAALKLTPLLSERALVVVSYDDIVAAAHHGPAIIENFRPIGLEAIDHTLFHDERKRGMRKDGLQHLPRPGDHAWLLVQFGADSREEVEAQAYEFEEWLRADQGIDEDRYTLFESDQEGGGASIIWDVREAGLGATAFPPDGGDHWPGWEDSAVPLEHLGGYVEDLQRLYDEHDLRGAMYGHFGQGCVHSRINFDLRSTEGIANYRRFMERAADLVVGYGGTLSGEHGDGQQRAELLEKQYGPDLMQAMRDFKRIWDPDWRMNPGKVVNPYKMDEDLRLGPGSDPPRPDVRFAYEQDGGDFVHAALRCVGVGKCRQPDGADVMCPSYQVTQEEEHTTRGRARLLFEMLQGEVITDGWQSREVDDALDLCLACKGCTEDCPVHVDIPTYKAEFLHKHYRSWKRWRRRHMYAFGFIDQAARLASKAPELVNLATQTPGLRSFVKLLGGLDQRRDLPRFAPMPLQRWFRQRGGTRNPDGPRVLLWPDTFNNYLHTDVGVACLEALEDAGWQVVMPDRHVCCGRPLYDYGFLDVAERYLHRTLDAVRDEIRAGTPVVGMEPSCLAVFKDELTGLLPHDDDAQRLAGNSFHFAEFFEEHGVEVPQLEGEALLWTHCHQHATGGRQPEKDLLTRMGLQVRALSGGCCGLAGSWGFEDGKYDISVDIGEASSLLPKVRDADPSTVVVANGFSCQTQVEQAGAGRRPLHEAQVLRLARQRGQVVSTAQPSEQGAVDPEPEPSTAVKVGRTFAGVAVLAAVVAGIGAGLRRAVGPSAPRHVPSAPR